MGHAVDQKIDANIPYIRRMIAEISKYTKWEIMKVAVTFAASTAGKKSCDNDVISNGFELVAARLKKNKSRE